MLRRRWFDELKLCLELIFDVPLSELTLVEMQPVLLWTNDHTRPHESHESDDFVGSEAIAVDEVSSDKTACPSQAGFAMHSDTLLLLDHVVREPDELLDDWESWAGAILKDHINVLNAESCEVCGAVELRVQPDDEANISFDEMGKDVLEWLRNVSRWKLRYA